MATLEIAPVYIGRSPIDVSTRVPKNCFEPISGFVYQMISNPFQILGFVAVRLHLKELAKAFSYSNIFPAETTMQKSAKWEESHLIAGNLSAACPSNEGQAVYFLSSSPADKNSNKSKP